MFGAEGLTESVLSKGSHDQKPHSRGETNASSRKLALELDMHKMNWNHGQSKKR